MKQSSVTIAKDKIVVCYEKVEYDFESNKNGGFSRLLGFVLIL